MVCNFLSFLLGTSNDVREAHKNFASEIEEEIVVIVGSNKKKTKTNAAAASSEAQAQDDEDEKPNVRVTSQLSDSLL